MAHPYKMKTILTEMNKWNLFTVCALWTHAFFFLWSELHYQMRRSSQLWSELLKVTDWDIATLENKTNAVSFSPKKEQDLLDSLKNILGFWNIKTQTFLSFDTLLVNYSYTALFCYAVFVADCS
jgi:hypothetical protein